MGSLKLLPVLILLGPAAALAQSPTFGLGRTPTADEILAWDISISPTGEELPPGSGTSEQGRRLFLQKGCARCHWPDGTDGRAPRLVSREGRPGANPWSRGRILPIRSPYATTVWDYLNRGMPLGDEGSLTADEVYALTAYLLNVNGVIADDAVMDQERLPMVQMPNRDNWAPLPDWQPGQPRLPGYGH